MEFLQDLKDSRAAYKERNYTKSYDILLTVILRLEQFGVDFHENREIEDADDRSKRIIDIRQRFYDLMRGDVIDDPKIRRSYKEGASPYTDHVWNLMSLERIGDPEMLSPDFESGQIIKIVHTVSGVVMNHSDWYKVYNYLIRELDLVAPILERKIFNLLTKVGVSV